MRDPRVRPMPGDVVLKTRPPFAYKVYQSSSTRVRAWVYLSLDGSTDASRKLPGDWKGKPDQWARAMATARIIFVAGY